MEEGREGGRGHRSEIFSLPSVVYQLHHLPQPSSPGLNKERVCSSAANIISVWDCAEIPEIITH